MSGAEIFFGIAWLGLFACFLHSVFKSPRSDIKATKSPLDHAEK